MPNSELDLQASPEKALSYLRAAARRMLEDASELEASWQDKGAGMPWSVIGAEIDAACDRAEKKLKERGYR